MTPSRRADLQQMLEERHRELATLVQTKVRRFREMDASDTTRRAEFSDDPAHEDIDFALVQMQSQTMTKISAALERLAVGEYGMCRDCEQDIAEKRLRALPFAERCTRCQESAESSEGRERRWPEGRERRRPQRDAGFPLGLIADTMLTRAGAESHDRVANPGDSGRNHTSTDENHTFATPASHSLPRTACLDGSPSRE